MSDILELNIQDLKEQFVKEFRAEAEANGYEVNWVMFNQYKDKFYIEWLEIKILKMSAKSAQLADRLEHLEDFDPKHKSDVFIEPLRKISALDKEFLG